MAKTLGKGSSRHRAASGLTHIKDLVPDPANRRSHNPRNIGMVVDALHQVGAARSIVIDEDNVILAGNGVTEAAAEAGITRVRVVDADGDELIAVRRSGLSVEQKRALAIFDNRTGELATWNFDQLAADKEAGLSLQPFWSTEEEAALLAKATTVQEGLTDPDAVPAERATDIKAGDLFELGRHRLLCGDCTKAEDVGRLMSGRMAGCVVTDPPYGINRDGIANDDPEGLLELFDGCLSVLPLRNGVVIAFQSPRLFPEWLDAARAHGHRFERMLWMYKPADCTFPWRGWLLKSEAILVSSIGEAGWVEVHPFMHDCYSPTTIGKELPEGVGTHASVKPIAIVEDLVQRVSGDVYEPFSGSGTTMIAAERKGRCCFGMELTPLHVQLSIDRWEAFTGQKAVKVGELVHA